MKNDQWYKLNDIYEEAPLWGVDSRIPERFFSFSRIPEPKKTHSRIPERRFWIFPNTSAKSLFSSDFQALNFFKQ